MSRQEYIEVAFSGLLSPYGLLFPTKPFFMLIGKMADLTHKMLSFSLDVFHRVRHKVSYSVIIYNLISILKWL